MKVCPGEDGVRHFDERIGVTMRILGMLLGTVLLAGCSTSTPSLDETDQVPKERLYNYQFRDDGDAFLVVSREREFLGSVCNTRLIIDSRLAAEIQAGESARFRLPAGLRVVSVQGDGICRGEAPKQVVHVQNGQTTHYRITVDSGLNIGLVPG